MDISKLTIFIVLFVFSSSNTTVTCQPVKMESVLDEMEEEEPDRGSPEHGASGFISNKLSFEEHTKDFILKAQARLEKQTEKAKQQSKYKNSAISSSDHLSQSSNSFIAASYFSLHPLQAAFSRFKRFALNGTVDPSRTNQLLLLRQEQQQQQKQQQQQQQQQQLPLLSSHNEITAATSILSNRRRKDTSQQSDSPSEQQQQGQGDDFFSSSTKNPLSVLSRNWRRQQQHFFSK